jgi:beta-glucanase (GH16 family)
MGTGRKISKAGRVALAGAALLGLAACQPQIPGTPVEADPVVGTPPGNGAPAPAPTTTTTTTTAPPSNPISAPAGWRYVGGDEFDGSTVDPSKWVRYHNTYGDGNKEMACLTPGNTSVGGGSLRIQARREQVTCPGGKVRSYTSGFLGSREAGTYYPRFARFEVRAKLPHAQGLWPAFWLRHRNGASVAEVDIMEYFHSQVPGRSTQTLHLDGRYNISKRTTTFEQPTLSPGWHTWAVEITPATGGVKFTFLVDGVTVHTYVDTQHRWASSAPADGTWDIALNLAVGGNWVGGPDDTLGVLRDISRCAQSGSFPNTCSTSNIRRVDWSNPAASTFQVDYVRVYVPR